MWKIVASTVSSGASGVWVLTWKSVLRLKYVERSDGWWGDTGEDRRAFSSRQTSGEGESVCCVSAALKGWCAVVSSKNQRDPVLVESWDTGTPIWSGNRPKWAHVEACSSHASGSHTVMPEASPETLDKISGLHSQIVHFSRSQCGPWLCTSAHPTRLLVYKPQTI